jgi:hypothetical protein
VAIREYLTKGVSQSKAAGVILKNVMSDNEWGRLGNLGWHSGRIALVDASGTITWTSKYLDVWRKANGK